jgi:Ni,Fe-hydrogenase I large subunit
VRDRLKAFADTGKMGIFGSAYWGHPAYQLTPEANLLLFSHYLSALRWQKEIVKVHALLGGKNPHPQTYLVGGMATPLDRAAPDALNLEKLGQIRSFVSEAREFIDKIYLPDLHLVARSYPEWKALGRGVGRYLTLGGFPGRSGGSEGESWLPPGALTAPNLSVEPVPVDTDQIREFVDRSWYKNPAGSDGEHPLAGQTVPQYSGPKPPFERLDTDGEYSWLKAPRYDGQPMEVGPLARMAIAYAAGHPQVVSAIGEAVQALGGEDALFSTIGRMVARGVETQVIAAQMPAWLDELESAIASGETTVHNGSMWDPASWPSAAEGWAAVAAPRGMLTHWVVIENGEIANYQAVVPSTWNGSPRDGVGRRGPWEQALLGTPVTDDDRPLELLRTVHSFDPCLACAVHVIDVRG